MVNNLNHTIRWHLEKCCFRLSPNCKKQNKKNTLSPRMVSVRNMMTQNSMMLFRTKMLKMWHTSKARRITITNTVLTRI